MINKGVEQRKNRVRAKIARVSNRPRLSVFKSNKVIYAQVIDDTLGKTIASAKSTEIKEKKTKLEKAALVGELVAKNALAKKIKEVVFDKGSYKYHGLVKALADGARKGGLSF